MSLQKPVKKVSQKGKARVSGREARQLAEKERAKEELRLKREAIAREVEAEIKAEKERKEKEKLERERKAEAERKVKEAELKKILAVIDNALRKHNVLSVNMSLIDLDGMNFFKEEYVNDYLHGRMGKRNRDTMTSYFQFIKNGYHITSLAFSGGHCYFLFEKEG